MPDYRNDICFAQAERVYDASYNTGEKEKIRKRKTKKPQFFLLTLARNQRTSSSWETMKWCSVSHDQLSIASLGRQQQARRFISYIIQFTTESICYSKRHSFFIITPFWMEGGFQKRRYRSSTLDAVKRNISKVDFLIDCWLTESKMADRCHHRLPVW